MRSIDWTGTVLSVGLLAPEQVRMVVHAPEVALQAMPGQFVAVDCTPDPEEALRYRDSFRAPFLRRPFSFCDVDRTAGTFSLAFRVQGAGTRSLSRFRPGDRLSFLGPLGHGFPIPEAGTCVAVGGGIGVYPLLHLLRVCRERGLGTSAVCGYRSAKEAFLLDEFRSVSDAVLFASDAGDLDFPGNAAEALASLWSAQPAREPLSVFTCGPFPMMRAVAAQSLAAGHPCHASLEERMGCGTGICLVCACKVRGGKDAEPEYRRCCTEGPVFDAREVAWE